jgi:hypothetical protein
MRRMIATLVLALGVACCSQAGQRLPLATDDSITTFGDGCVLDHEVVDVTMDPSTGSPVFNDGGTLLNLKWPKGFTAWRSGAQTQVIDAAGNVVLTTGNRYSVCSSPDFGLCMPYGSAHGGECWVVGRVRPCPDCALGFGVD